MSFGQIVTSVRKARGINQITLARKARITPSYLSRLENDDRPPPSRDVVQALAAALELSPDEKDLLLVEAGYPPEHDIKGLLLRQPTMPELKVAHDNQTSTEEVTPLNVASEDSLQVVRQLANEVVALVDDTLLKPHDRALMLAVGKALPLYIRGLRSQISPVSSAVGLFLEAARIAQPNFTLSYQERKLVESVCDQLNRFVGLDDAAYLIRLVAASISESTLEERSHKLWLLDNRLRRLPHDTPLLESAVVEWSYYTLSKREQTLLQRLSVFANGWTDQAARSVCAEVENDPEEIGAISSALQKLADKALVTEYKHMRNGEARYAMSDITRKFAWKRLYESEQGVERCEQRHAGYYRQLADKAERNLLGREQKRFLNMLEIELPNIRRALENQAISKWERLELAAALGWFWEIRGHYREGVDCLLSLLPENILEVSSIKEMSQEAQRTAIEQTLLIAKCCHLVSKLTSRMSDYNTGSIYAHGSLSLLGELERVVSECDLEEPLRIQYQRYVSRNFGYAWIALGFSEGTRAFFDNARNCFKSNMEDAEREDEWGIAMTYYFLGQKLQFTLDREKELRAALEESKRLQIPWGQAHCSLFLGYGMLYNDAKEPTESYLAESYLEDSLRQFQEIQDKWGIAWSLVGLVFAGQDLQQHNYKQILGQLNESLSLFEEMEDDGGWGIATVLATLGIIACKQQQWGEAVELFEAHRTLNWVLAEKEGHRSPFQITLIHRYREALKVIRDKRVQLREDELNVREKAGENVSLETAPDYAREVIKRVLIRCN